MSFSASYPEVCKPSRWLHRTYQNGWWKNLYSVLVIYVVERKQNRSVAAFQIAFRTPLNFSSSLLPKRHCNIALGPMSLRELGWRECVGASRWNRIADSEVSLPRLLIRSGWRTGALLRGLDSGPDSLDCSDFICDARICNSQGYVTPVNFVGPKFTSILHGAQPVNISDTSSNPLLIVKLLRHPTFYPTPT